MTPFRLPSLGLATAALLAIAGCSDAPPAGGAPDAVPPLAAFEVQPAGGGVLRWYDGTVEAVRQATLRAQTAGRIAAAPHDVGDRVREGELLLRLTGVEQRAGLDQAEQALREAEAHASMAEAEFKRIADVYERRLVARTVYDRAVAERDATTAQLAAARAGVEAARENAGYTEVRAPYDAVVTRRHVEPGEAVAPGQPLLEVVAPERLRVAVDLPSADADAVRAGGAASVLVGERRYASSAVTVFPSATPGSSTVRIRVDLPKDAAGLYPGLYAKVGFAPTPGESATAVADDRAALGALAVPAATIVERSEVTGVYVLDEDGRPRLRQVRLGRRLGDQVEVLAGLAPGERIAEDPIAAAQALVAAQGPR